MGMVYFTLVPDVDELGENCIKKRTHYLLLGFILGSVWMYHLWFCWFICVIFKKCISRKTRRKFFKWNSYMISYQYIFAIAVSVLVFMVELFEFFPFSCPGLGLEILLTSAPQFLLTIWIFAQSSRALRLLNSLNSLRYTSPGDKDLNIWEHINVNESPQIQFHVDCYHTVV